jgi:hypothetical protein
VLVTSYIEIYKFLMRLQIGDSQCWEAYSESINEDEYAADGKHIRWSAQGGVSHMSGGDDATLGTMKDNSFVVARVKATSEAVSSFLLC